MDIFFVISGFVMTVTAPGLAGKPNKARVFLKRRLVRVVPLYWIFTTLSLARLLGGVMRGQSLAEQTHGSLWHLIASYLFIPAFDDQHAVFPVVGIGWTLNFEMMFYLLFAAALALDVSLLAFLVPVLLALAAVGCFDHTGWPAVATLASSITLEFLFGVLIAHWTLQGHRPNPLICAALFVGGCAAIAVFPRGNFRWLTWGLPAAAIVTATGGWKTTSAKNCRAGCWRRGTPPTPCTSSIVRDRGCLGRVVADRPPSTLRHFRPGDAGGFSSPEPFGGGGDPSPHRTAPDEVLQTQPRTRRQRAAGAKRLRVGSAFWFVGRALRLPCDGT